MAQLSKSNRSVRCAHQASQQVSWSASRQVRALSRISSENDRGFNSNDTSQISQIVRSNSRLFRETAFDLDRGSIA